MKKLLMLFLITIMLVQVVPVAAEGYISDWVNVEFYVAPSSNFLKTEAVFELYNMNDDLLATESFWITGTGRVYDVKFYVPQYPIGTQFKLKMVKGFLNMQHYDSVVGEGSYVVLSTYSFIPEGSTEVVIGDYFGVNCTPYSEQNMDVYVNGSFVQNHSYLKRDNGEVLAEVVDMMNFFKIPASNYRVSYNQLEISHNDRYVIFSVGSNAVYVNGQTWYTGALPQYLEGRMYVSVQMMAAIFSAQYSEYELYDKKIINLTYETVNDLEARMNREGLSSKTDYLIWINKSTYTVNVFLGNQGNWHLIKEFPCAIGAPETPTITGTFTYYQWEAAWNYDAYYVGPVMRFYGNGYAIHSTKVKYDGTDYDGRTGVGISLGCVRLRPENMNWLSAMVPLHTTIHITEK